MRKRLLISKSFEKSKGQREFMAYIMPPINAGSAMIIRLIHVGGN